ncbi:outer membrane beta-barrel protein [Nitrospirillum sp. BR 11752]|uniref:outer membrane protein n=1 Tax=Nitrospirillum sp. BR 11752 TaxID=3104293 RepID=UPI002EA95878|nr:outer membrane beta-barrel protein [Nitrospirillum sp. BR 11752]
MIIKTLAPAALLGVTLLALPASSGASAADWPGLYAGVNAGGTFGAGGAASAGSGGRTSRYNSNNAFGGAQVGYNFELSPMFILGIENDFDYAGKQSKKNGTTSSDTALPWFGSGRLKAGFTPAGLDMLVYGMAGLAFGQVDNRINTRMRGGWTAGGGIEWMVLPHLSTKVGYLYTDLSKSFKNDNLIKTEARFHAVRFGVNYHF